MNGKNLLDKMSDVDPKLIEDADKTPRHSRKWFIGITSGAATVAAAALIAVAIGNNAAQKPPVVDTSDPASSAPVTSDIVNSGNTSTQEPPVVDLTPKDPPKLDFSKYKDLPKISYSQPMEGGKGGEVYIGAKDGVEVIKGYYNYSQLEQSSPWKGAVLETMPVYMSHSTDPNLGVEKMYARAREVAAALGIPEDSLEFTDSYEDMTETLERHRQMARDHGATEEEIDDMIKTIIRGIMSQTYVEAENDDVRISVDTALHTYVYFQGKSIKLPDGYNFTESATDEEKAALVDYFAEKYKSILNFSKPALRKVESYRNIYFYIYDSDGDLTQQIVNYWLNSPCFAEDHENAGELSNIWFYTDDNCEKLGDYPILTPDQAEAILKSNKFDDELRMPANAKILKTDMVYKNGSGCTGIIPYYQFYVETDKGDSNADVACLIYTIPAVPEEFIDIDTGDYGAKA